MGILEFWSLFSHIPEYVLTWVELVAVIFLLVPPTPFPHMEKSKTPLHG